MVARDGAEPPTPAFSELSCTFNNLQVADGCVSPSNYVQVGLIVGCIVGCESERRETAHHQRESKSRRALPRRVVLVGFVSPWQVWDRCSLSLVAGNEHTILSCTTQQYQPTAQAASGVSRHLTGPPRPPGPSDLTTPADAAPAVVHLPK
jgi:hypothetical protein